MQSLRPTSEAQPWPIAQDQVWPPDTASKGSLGPQTPGLNWSQPQLSLLLGALTPPSTSQSLPQTSTRPPHTPLPWSRETLTGKGANSTPPTFSSTKFQTCGVPTTLRVPEPQEPWDSTAQCGLLPEGWLAQDAVAR